MPVAPTYPGVYVEELPSGVHTITGVSTAVTAVVGYFPQGPMDTATRVQSVADLERSFGPLVAASEAGYTLRQFFANGGGDAWVVRVAGGSPKPAAIAVMDKPGGAAVLTATAASAGLWGANLRLAIDYATTDPTTLFNLTVMLVDTSTPPQVVATEIYRNLNLTANDPANAVTVVNASSSLIKLATAGSGLPAATGTVSSADIKGVDLTTLGGASMKVALGATLIGSVTLATAPASLAALAASLQSQIRALPAASGVSLPSATVSVVGSASTQQFLQVLAGTGNPADIVELSDVLAGDLKLDDAAHTNVARYALGATAAAGAQALPGGTAAPGNDGSQPDATSLIGDPGTHSGMHALDLVDIFNLLCLPDTMNRPDTEAAAVISAAETYCQSRSAFLIVDVPQSAAGTAGAADRDALGGIEAWIDQNATLRSTYAALYYPRPNIPDPLNGYRLRAVASSGTIAGLYARTDAARGVWKAPAGTEALLTNVVSLATKLTDAENGVLNPVAVNCLRSFPVYGNVCWGARTLMGADQETSDWKYIPVRRTALYIESSLYYGTQWVVFEPNDEPLWAQIRLNVGAFMRGLFQQGAFQGSTPAKAYFVKCDGETTTQTDINLGRVNIVVGFAPLKPAEFVVIQIQQIAGQIPT
ncbi:MAG TPA: phage tail sheath C-terminal domain-containing protein [Actinomycetota bacterium]|nr:phage tail sheath C-terminal domain-containing protein [Actinomycetota bacterium]